jgi:hypothetical protein
MWTLVKMTNTTGELTLITDGERRYGQVLFDRNCSGSQEKYRFSDC